MSAIHQAVAAAVVDRIDRDFIGRKGLVRVAGFRGAEVTVLLEALCTWARSDIVVVAIAKARQLEWPSDVQVTVDQTPTLFRNSTDACVFVELDEFSDAQGLRNVKTITDSDVLGGVDSQEERILELAAAAWQAMFGPEQRRSMAIDDALVSLMRVFSRENLTANLRATAAFLVQVFSDLEPSKGISEADVWRSFGAALPIFGLFQDCLLATASGAVVSERRLHLNVAVSQERGPNGKHLDRDDLVERVATATFTAPDGSALSAAEESAVRSRLTAYLRSPESPDPRGIELSHWENLFEAASTRLGLGDRVFQEIHGLAPDRLPELESMAIVPPLNQKERSAAIKLLDGETTPEEGVPLADLLTLRTRRAVERVAYPSAPAVQDPLRHLVQLVYEELADADGTEGSLWLRPRRKKQQPPRVQNLSLALFAFLFGRSLADVVESTSSNAPRFQVDEALLEGDRIRRLVADLRSQIEHQDQDESSEHLSDDRWPDLELELAWETEADNIAQFRWSPRSNPGYVVTALSFLASDAHYYSAPDIDFDEWSARALDTLTLEGAHSVQGISNSSDLAEASSGQGPVMEWLLARASFFREAAETGLDCTAIDRYADKWIEQLANIHRNHVPEGASLPEVARFLQVDCHRGPAASPTMLATHPLRLRWLARHLIELTSALEQAVRGELVLNSENDQFYFSQLAQRSPHAQPPLLSDDSHIYVPVRETCWHERYDMARDKTRTHSDWLSDIDDASIDEMAASIATYVDAHPHKLDGLTLLLVIRSGGARLCRRIVQQVLNHNANSGSRRRRPELTLHVLSPPGEFGSVARSLSEFEQSDERISKDFPSVRLILHAWSGNDNEMPSIDGLSGEVDVAMVPNLFSTHTRLLEENAAPGARHGRFDVWRDRSAYRKIAGERQGTKNVSRVLLPRERDEALEMWSTVCVRHFRSKAMGADAAPGETDFMSLLVEVTESETFFSEIHRAAHWVVTLDAFVGREQLEALDVPPDVITVKPELGKSGMHTLVVSSQSGRDFVVRRLARRLKSQLGDQSRVPCDELAHAIYHQARDLAPGTLLRALGLGRTAQELVGIVVSRELVTQFDPIDLGQNGFELWISLDAHPEWFPSSSTTRADMVRVVGKWSDAGLRLRVTVVEAKLRDESAVNKASQQVSRSVKLLAEALRPAEMSNDGADWRRALMRALDDAAWQPRNRSGHFAQRVVSNGSKRTEIPDEVRVAFRNGDFEIESIDGTICSVSLTAKTSGHSTTPEGGHRWIRATALEMERALEGVLKSSTGCLEDAPALTASVVRTSMGQSADVLDPRGTVGHEASSDAPSAPIASHRPTPPLVPGTTPAEHGNLALVQRYQQVLDTFHEYGVGVERVEEEPMLNGPGFFVFRVKPKAGVRPTQLMNFDQELQYKLGLPDGFFPRAYVDGGSVVFEIPKRPDERFYIDADDLWEHFAWPTDELAVPLGVDVRGDLVSISFSSNNTPHLLIGGITGSGKSVVIDTILEGLTRHYGPEQLRLSLVDPKETELQRFEGDPHLDGPIGMDGEDAIEILDAAVSEMNRRYKLMKAARVRKISEYNAQGVGEHLPWKLVLLDEYADLTSDRDERKKIEHLLQRLAQKARACGIHCIIATQKPSADIISTKIRSNLAAQIALRVKTAQDSRVVMDETGAETLAGNGDAFLKSAGGEKVRLQCAKVRGL